MQAKDGLNPAERELEEALKSLAPATVRIDTVSAAFEAGRRTAQRQVQVWRFAAAAALVVGLGGWMIPRGIDVSPGRQSETPMMAQAPPAFLAEPLAAQSLLMLQAAVLEHGLAGLPTTQLPVVGSGRPHDIL